MAALGMATQRIGKRTSIKDVAIDLAPYPAVYDRYVRLAGNELEHPVWRLGARDLLDQVVSGGHALSSSFTTGTGGPDGSQAAFITRIIQEYRALAAAELMRDPGFRDLFSSASLRSLARSDSRRPEGRLSARPLAIR
jgi:hypothetical protein